MKVVVQRKSDGYERVFSVKRQCEMGAENRWRGAFLEAVVDKQARDSKLEQERNVRAAWSAVEQAGRDKNVSQLREALHSLIKVVDEPLL
jgi:hypothetical protein